VPGWALPRGRDINEADAAFGAGIALKSLDDLILAEMPWLGCWRDRLALKSAAVAAQMLSRSEEEGAIRDAVLLTVAGDDPGPAGKLFLATRMLTRRTGPVTTSFVKEIADLFGLRWNDGLASIPDIVDSANQSGRAAPFAVADLIAAISAVRPDAEVLALGLAEAVLAHKLNWPKSVPLLLPERYGPAFRRSVAEAASGRASRLIQQQSAWRWSTVSTPRCAPLPRLTAVPRACSPWHQNCAPRVPSRSSRDC
jgi:hypothetical protein